MRGVRPRVGGAGRARRLGRGGPGSGGRVRIAGRPLAWLGFLLPLPASSALPTWACACRRAPGNGRPRSAASPPPGLRPRAPRQPRAAPPLPAASSARSHVDAVLGVTRRRRLHAGSALAVPCPTSSARLPARPGDTPHAQLDFRGSGGGRRRHCRAGAGHAGAQAPGRRPRPRPRGNGGASSSSTAPRGRGGGRRPRNREHQRQSKWGRPVRGVLEWGAAPGLAAPVFAPGRDPLPGDRGRDARGAPTRSRRFGRAHPCLFQGSRSSPGSAAGSGTRTPEVAAVLAPMSSRRADTNLARNRT